ncbi:hypothetical protein ACF1GY_36765 [Streptomyces sp. NPDC014684]|uniref:hypothetical protein n=1 Tax=Streptomyces sp. NPDC014684 TaxID=3364880 RepID=UPI003702554B
MTTALPADALKGTRIGVSVGTSSDLPSLGLDEGRFRTALGELVRLLLSAGASLAYGGNLREDGYTGLLLDQVREVTPASRPLLHCLAWYEHRAAPLSELAARREEFAHHGEVVCLSIDGEPVDPVEGRGEEPVPESDPATRARALTGMRRHLAARVDGQLLLGGKRDGFLGSLPGLLEEALLALEAGRPCYLAAGFGGVTADIARTLGAEAAPDAPRAPDTASPGPDLDPRLVDGLQRLRALMYQPGRTGHLPKGLTNGLTTQENHVLTGTRSPLEIASLTAVGIERLRGRV